MATVAFDGTRVSQAESETDGGTWDKWGVTQSPTQETDFILQGTYEISNKISASTGGVDFDWTTPVAFNGSPNKVLIPKFQVSTYSLIDISVAEGLSYQVGSGSGAYYNYHIVGSVKGSYPPNGGWLAIPIDPNVSTYRDGTTGSPNLGSVAYTGLWVKTTGSVKSENLIHSALDYVDHGTGLTLTGTSGNFILFVTTDEDTTSGGKYTNRWRLASRADGSNVVFNALATWTIGSSTATTFTDSNKVVKWPGGRVNTGFHGLTLVYSNASTDISIQNCTFISDGVKATNDSRANFTMSGTTGATTLSGLTFINFNAFTLTAKTLTGFTLVKPQQVTQGGATITGWYLSQPTTASGEAAIVSASPANAGLISNTEFVSSGTGHAIEIGGTAANTTLTNVTFSGYASSDGSTGNEAVYVNIASGSMNLTISGGTTPSVKTAGCAVTVVSGAVTATAKAVTESGTAISGATVHIEATGAGPFPVAASVSITRSGSTATVSHTAHAMATNDKVVIRGADQDEYNGVFTITKISDNSYSYVVSGTPASPATGTITSTFVVLNGTTDVNGEVTMSRVFPSDQPVTGRIRKSTSAPYYKQATISGTVDSSTGAYFTGVMISDD